MTNIIEFKTSKVEALFVSVPEEFKNFVIQQYPVAGTYLMETDSKALNHWKVQLPKADYSILCRLNEASEEQAKSVVDEPVSVAGLKIFRDYSGESDYYLMTAIVSLKSFAKSLGAKDNDLILIKNK